MIIARFKEIKWDETEVIQEKECTKCGTMLNLVDYELEFAEIGMYYKPRIKCKTCGNYVQMAKTKLTRKD